MANKRIEWIDSLKGLGMILVILGHMSIPEMARQLIFSFHMPLFFFISGYLYRKTMSPQWVLRKLDALLIPYLIYGSLTLLAWMFVGKIDFKSGIAPLVSGNGLGLTWFFSCMLITELVGGALLIFEAKVPRWVLWFVVFGLAVFGWLLPQAELPSYFKSNVVPMALVFWLAGWLLREREFKWYELTAGVVFASFFWVQRIDMNTARYGNGFLFVGTALGFIGLLVWVFRKFNISWKPLTFVGERSLEFMCLHGLIPLVCTNILERMGLSVPKLLLRPMYLVLVVALAYWIRRYSRLLSGRMPIFQILKKQGAVL